MLTGESAPDDVSRRIAEFSEQLHRARLLRRFIVLWAFAGNAVLAAAAVGCFLLLGDPEWWILTLAVIIPVASVAGSVTALYRQYFKVRGMAIDLRDLHRARREHLLDDVGGDLLAAHKRYRAQLPEAVRDYRAQARRYRYAHNGLQVLVISGAIVSSVVAAVSVSVVDIRWVVVGVSLFVALTAAVAGYGKYRERSINLQQTADALEREYHSVELRVGKYRRFETEQAAYAEFANEAEALLDEHAKRQQQVGPSFVPETVV